MAWILLRPEPYDPDARDGDGDGVVQERTPWERPLGTRVLDFSGTEVERGRSLTERPRGIRIVDREGRDIPYIPSYERTAGGQSHLSRIGYQSLADAGSPSVRELRGPRVVRAPEKLVNDSFDEDIRRATTLLKPVSNDELSRLKPKERRAVLRARKVVDAVLKEITDPQERSVLSDIAGNSFYWVTTVMDSSGTLTSLLNSIWAGAADAGYNPHAVLEEMYEWGGTYALTMPFLLLKERMKLTRKQISQVSDRFQQRFAALGIKAGKMNDALKERYATAMDKVRAAWKSREGDRVAGVAHIADLLEDAVESAAKATIVSDFAGVKTVPPPD